jgi:hypothetical protein
LSLNGQVFGIKDTCGHWGTGAGRQARTRSWAIWQRGLLSSLKGSRAPAELHNPTTLLPTSNSYTSPSCCLLSDSILFFRLGWAGFESGSSHPHLLNSWEH